MKAIVYKTYGPPEVLKLEEAEKPTPKANEVLIKILATPVNFGDLLARKFNQVSPAQFSMPFPLWLLSRFAFGFNKPRVNVLGSEFAGVVEAAGKDVTRFHAGDPVFGYRGMVMGTYAEYCCMAENGMLAIKPSNLSFAQAATIPYGALTALSLLRQVNIQKGKKVLVNGASGGIGSYALQFAKIFGAEVTGVCGTPRMEMVKSLGADKVIDYTREDFTQNGETYDLIFDVLGKRPFCQVKNSLKPDGVLLLASFKMLPLIQMLGTKISGGKKVICALSSEKPQDLVYIKELVEAGKLKTVVDRCFPPEEAAAAHRYVETGQKTGNVVILFDQNEETQGGS